MNNNVHIHRLATGIPGPDEVLGGGFPALLFNLIAGLAGCGTTTLAHPLMFTMATPERPALYFTMLGEPPLKTLRRQPPFDFFDEAAVNVLLRFINLGEDALPGDLNQLLGRTRTEVQAHSPALPGLHTFGITAAGMAIFPPAGMAPTCASAAMARLS